MTYDFPPIIQGNYSDGVTFNVAVNGSGLNLSGASIVMEVYQNLQSPCNTTTYTTDNSGLAILDNTGVFAFNPQIVSITPYDYLYDITFNLANGQVKTYISGSFEVLSG